MAGQKGRSGRKSKSSEDELKRLLDRNWPQKKRAAMIKAWAARAEAGDLEAGKLLMDRAYGKSREHKTVEFTGLDAARAALKDIIQRFELSEAEAIPIIAEQFGVNESELISEAIN